MFRLYFVNFDIEVARSVEFETRNKKSDVFIYRLEGITGITVLIHSFIRISGIYKFNIRSAIVIVSNFAMNRCSGVIFSTTVYVDIHFRIVSGLNLLILHKYAATTIVYALSRGSRPFVKTGTDLRNSGSRMISNSSLKCTMS